MKELEGLLFSFRDIGVMNEEGCVKLVGRKSDLIIRGGVNIYPLEIENFLNTHPAILEVHVSANIKFVDHNVLKWCLTN